MRCQTCQYDLTGLTEHRCPECGQPFDPEREHQRIESLQKSARALLIVSIACAIYPLFMVVSFHLHWIAARIRLGHWPQIYRDDAKFITGLEWFHSLNWGLLVCALPVLALNLMFAIGAATMILDLPARRMRRRGWLVFLGVLTWPGAFFMLQWDPAGILIWFFD